MISSLAQEIEKWIAEHHGVEPKQIRVSQSVFDECLEEAKRLGWKKDARYAKSKTMMLRGILVLVDPTLTIGKIEFMTTLEKAAKAMFEQVRARAKSAGLIFGPETQWEELPDWAQKEYTDQVRAALESLKDSNALEKSWNDALATSDNWRHTLEVILNEKPDA